MSKIYKIFINFLIVFRNAIYTFISSMIICSIGAFFVQLEKGIDKDISVTIENITAFSIAITIIYTIALWKEWTKKNN
jgi:uncharacterized membrane protein